MRVINLGISLVAVLFLPIDLGAQHFNIHNPLTLPDKSQRSTTSQRIGYTDVTVIYHSPGANGREIWGDLVPYGKVWRIGANTNTTFSVTDEVQIGGQTLAAGTYGLHLLPEEDQWTFIFSKNHTSWGSYFYQEAEDALRFTANVEAAPEERNWMSIDFHTRDRAETSVVLTWGDKRARFDFSLDIDSIALQNIRNQLRSDAYWEWFSWCQAADYCAQYEINTEEALEWIDRSIEMEENFRNWDVKEKLLTQMGDAQGAKQAIARAIEVGSDVHLERYGRRLLQQQKYERAIFVFEQALEKNDQYWRAHLNKGKALQALGSEIEALAAFKEALKNAPENNKKQIADLIK